MARSEKRVMICDDRPWTVEPLADRLRTQGLEVEVTTRPRECLERARRLHFDLFILDLYLGVNNPPELRDGLALAQALWNRRDSAVNVPVVGITGRLPDWEERALAMGLVHFYKKPFDLRVVVPELVQLIDSGEVAFQAVDRWLTETRGGQWGVLEINVSMDGEIRLRSNLVAGVSRLRVKPADFRLGLRLLSLGHLDEESFEDLGQSLSQGLLPSPIDIGFHQLHLLSQLAERPFRLLLRLESNDWQRLPWEYCRYSGGINNGHWLGGDSRLTCTRLASNSGPLIADQVLKKPLRIMVVGAQPPGTSPLSLKDELSVIKSALAPIEDSVEWRILGPVEIGADGEADPPQVNQDVSSFKPHIIHFMCHGQGSRLILEQDADLAIWSDVLLGLDLNDRGVQLVFFNCCLSAQPGQRSPGIALSTVCAGVQSVIGHFLPIEDLAAVRLAGDFYRGLAKGWALDHAFQEARRLGWSEEVRHERSFLPILFVRDHFFRIAD